MEKLNELRFELLSHLLYSPDLTPSDLRLFADLKRMLKGKRIGSKKEVVADVEAYIESKNKSFYEMGIKN
ncbi:histone-lysine N-methyltransferase SETMAR [Trichonephila clavipes]|uniref:Histone-lysine N-methyltransferase SETMAR n=1 Tax=Trichonephila clavipes TaxID=2585209 RepID=A0A8X6V8J4_TRICX|nr:histone-lysine N-methyltransferase SETMAR [Trichonephila clavipes]